MFTKTIKLRIYPTKEQADMFRDLTEVYRQACNFVSAYVFEHGFELNYMKLNKALYRTVREQFGLKANLTQSVFRTVTARYKTVQDQLRRKPFKYKDENGGWQRIEKTLEWLWKPIYFRRPQADFVRGDEYCFLQRGHQLSLNTLCKRAKVDYADRCFAPYFDGTWKFGTGKLVELKGKWYFHLPVSKNLEHQFSKDEVQHVVGLDRGLRFLVTGYDEHGYTSFVSGKDVCRKREKFARLRAKLQSKKTYSAKRRLRKLSGRENRWMSDVNHRISKALVEHYGSNTLFVLEDLVGVSFEESNLGRSAKQKRQLRSWAFSQLEQFLTYKAHENQSEVVQVSAKYTSQRCPKCGSIHKEHRHHDIHEYICDNCGYRSNDDRVGAMNIQQLGTMWIAGEEHPKFTKLVSAG